LEVLNFSFSLEVEIKRKEPVFLLDEVAANLSGCEMLFLGRKAQILLLFLLILFVLPRTCVG
jgi:hypothetical protein